MRDDASVPPGASIGAAGFDANQAVPFECQDAEHTVAWSIDPFFQSEFLPVVPAEAVADQVAVLRHAALAFDLERAVAGGDHRRAHTRG